MAQDGVEFGLGGSHSRCLGLVFVAVVADAGDVCFDFGYGDGAFGDGGVDSAGAVAAGGCLVGDVPGGLELGGEFFSVGGGG